MSVKPKIKGVVIVEGKTDSNKLQSLFDVRTIETNGTHLSTKTIELIKQTAKQHRIILFLDPDGPGEAIRRKLNKYLDSYDQAFIKKTDIASKKKIGVAEAYDRAIIKAFKDTLSYDKNQSSLTWEEYLQLDLGSKDKRKKITDYLNISESNNKQLFKRLNMLNLTYQQLYKIVKE